MDIKRELDEYRVLEVAGSAPRRGSQRYLLSTLEVGVVVLGCVVFVGALVTALCVTCVRRNKRYAKLFISTLLNARNILSKFNNVALGGYTILDA